MPPSQTNQVSVLVVCKGLPLPVLLLLWSGWRVCNAPSWLLPLDTILYLNMYGSPEKISIWFCFACFPSFSQRAVDVWDCRTQNIFCALIKTQKFCSKPQHWVVSFLLRNTESFSGLMFKICMKQTLYGPFYSCGQYRWSFCWWLWSVKYFGKSCSWPFREFFRKEIAGGFVFSLVNFKLCMVHKGSWLPNLRQKYSCVAITFQPSCCCFFSAKEHNMKLPHTFYCLLVWLKRTQPFLVAIGFERDIESHTFSIFTFNSQECKSCNLLAQITLLVVLKVSWKRSSYVLWILRA